MYSIPLPLDKSQLKIGPFDLKVSTHTQIKPYALLKGVSQLQMVEDVLLLT